MIKRHLLIAAAVAVTSLTATAGTASATTVEKNVDGGCRIGASVFEHFGAARHISYDDNGACAKIRQKAVRRCWGTTYTEYYGYTTSNEIDRQWTGCDGIMTETYARNSSDTFLGSVEAWT